MRVYFYRAHKSCSHKLLYCLGDKLNHFQAYLKAYNLVYRREYGVL